MVYFSPASNSGLNSTRFECHATTLNTPAPSSIIGWTMGQPTLGHYFFGGGGGPAPDAPCGSGGGGGPGARGRARARVPALGAPPKEGGRTLFTYFGGKEEGGVGRGRGERRDGEAADPSPLGARSEANAEGAGGAEENVTRPLGKRVRPSALTAPDGAGAEVGPPENDRPVTAGFAPTFIGNGGSPERDRGRPVEATSVASPSSATDGEVGGSREWPSDDEGGLEEARRENVARNRAMLSSLGLQGATTAAPRGAPQRAGANGKKPPRKVPRESLAVIPLRRSTRSRAGGGGAASGVGPPTEAVEDRAIALALSQSRNEAEGDEERRRFLANVKRYSMEDSRGTERGGSLNVARALGLGDGDDSIAASGLDGDHPGEATFAALAGIHGGIFESPDVKKIYSIDLSEDRRLLACGGHGGRVAVFGTCDYDGADGGLGFQAGRGWIGEVQFASTSADRERPMLFTSGNDGCVALWEAGDWRSGAVPRQVVERRDLHAGGIFSLHEGGGVVVTCGKDGRVSRTVVDPATASLRLETSYDQHRVGVAKCVRLQTLPLGPSQGNSPPVLMADCGNDGAVCVLDARVPPHGVPSTRIQGAHSGAGVNFVEWHPQDQHVLLSAGFDPCVRLWDLRSTSRPLNVLTGHHEAASIRGMHRPSFCGPLGGLVATTGERSHAVSLYRCMHDADETTAPLSSNDVGYSPTAIKGIFLPGSAGIVLVASARQTEVLSIV